MKNEIMRNGKIIDEISTCMLNRGYFQFTIGVNYSTIQTKLLVDILNLSEDDLIILNKTLSQGRDMAIEEYGWELLGESPYSDDLHMVAMCIDDFTLEEKIIDDEKHTIFTFIRNH